MIVKISLAWTPIIVRFLQDIGMRASPAAATLYRLLIGDGSRLVVQVYLDLKASLAFDLVTTDVHRFPTAAGLAARATNQSVANAQLGHVADRAAVRCKALAARSGRRAS
jgi:hypothetical protein